MIDMYPLQRARLAVQLAVDGFQRASTTPAHTLGISAVIATHLEVLREQCHAAAEKSIEDVAKAQFKSISRGLTGAAAMVVAAIKGFVREPSEKLRNKCSIFAAPLMATIDALIEYAQSEHSFAGLLASARVCLPASAQLNPPPHPPFQASRPS